VAAQLKQDLGVVAELTVGNPGEFTVWVDDQKVAEKDWRGFPEPDDVVDAVRDATPPASS
jgi:predicted Rdx family selenoprotein